MTSKTNTFKDLMADVEEASYILIAGHISPDGDAIGACTAMGLILEQKGKDYHILLEDPGDQYSFLLETVSVLSKAPSRKSDLFIAFDCADLGRLGPFQEAFNESTISWNVDHHISNTNYANHNYVDAKASSASEIVYDIYKQSNAKMNKQIASAIYTGIVYDTARFRHSNTTSKTLAIASELITYSFDFPSINQQMFYEKPLVAIQLQGAATANIETFFNKQLVISSLSLEEIQLYSKDGQGAEGIVNLLKSIKNSKVAVFLYEKSKGEVKLSLRAEDPYDVCEVAKNFGGGGHVKAAGATISGTLEQAKEEIIPLVKSLFK